MTELPSETPASALYRADHATLRERVLARSFHLLDPLPDAPVVPASLLPGCLDEPIVVLGERGFSNVCTHRGALLVTEPCRLQRLRCPYHGRRFGLDGVCQGSPGFAEVTPLDDLPEVAIRRLGPLVFACLRREAPLALDVLIARVGWLPLADFVLAETRDYDVAADWVLWMENYLEGLHVPFVHPGLAGTLDLSAYRIETFPGGSLQIGAASAGEVAFELPEGHPDAGQRIAGYYFAIHPTTALNFYPWGLSVNRVLPLGPGRTRIRYHSYVWKQELRGLGAGGALDEVEQEDDRIVESVQRGARSRMFRGGRLCAQERAVAWFQEDLLQSLRRVPEQAAP